MWDTTKTGSGGLQRLGARNGEGEDGRGKGLNHPAGGHGGGGTTGGNRGHLVGACQ